MTGLEHRLDLGRLLRQRQEGDLDLLAGLLLEGGDHLGKRLVLLRINALLPRHHEVGGLCPERSHAEGRGEKIWDKPRHGLHSARICLIRAIASSTACSGVIPSVTTRWTAFSQTPSVLTRS
jgi:hypothetical protein